MQLIQNGTQGPTTIPAKQTAVGTPGYAYGGPPGATPASRWDPDVANTLLAELAAVVLASGQSLNPANNAQLLQALFALPLKNVQVYATAGTFTFTVPAYVTALLVETWGGGSGSPYGAGGWASGGGGAGGYAAKLISGLTPGATIAVTVGAAGAAGSNVALTTGGGTSSFGAYASATGGIVNAAVTLSDGTARSGGGSGSGGDVNIAGGWSEIAVATINGAGTIGGNGGAAARGGPGGGGNVALGTAGGWPGGGGGGSGAGYSGRPGAAGGVIVRW